MTALACISPFASEILDLRHFSSAALRDLLQEEMQAWSDLLCWDYRASADMILRYLDGKILPGYVAVRGGVVGGYCFFVYEGVKAVVGDLFVRQDFRDSATETLLLTHSLATLQQSPGVRRVEAQLLLHESGAVAPIFQNEGFRRYPRLFMVLPLKPVAGEQSSVAANMPPEANSFLPQAISGRAAGGRQYRNAGWQLATDLESEVEIRPWSEQDYSAASSVITAAYQNHVDADINEQYRSSAGCLRFLNNIVRFPGCGNFDGSASFVAVHRRTRTLVGLILCSRVSENVGHITQVCVVPDLRGRRLGELLLAITAAELRRRNFRAITLTVTRDNFSAIKLYERLGYRTRRVFDAFVWGE